MIELLLLLIIALFIVFYRNYSGNNMGKFITKQTQVFYNKYAPYSFKKVRDKTKELGQEYTPRQYLIQIVLLGGFAGVVSYLYFYNLVTSVIYIIVAIAFVPYLAFLRCKRVYSEFIFEQIQVYTSNTIMEFATTQSFVKSLEGVIESGILEDPVKRDVQHMIDLAYQNGTIDESLAYMANLYPFYIVKNMHQLFLQITKEGAKDSSESLDNMQNDIDMLVESVYRDRIDRQTFHQQFIQFGLMIYFMVMVVQYLVGRESYLNLLDSLFVRILLHLVLIVNTYFLIKGEKFYNENVGAE